MAEMSKFMRLSPLGKPIKFKNVAIGGEFEPKMTPWTIVFLIGLYLQPTPKAKEYFDDENEMKMHIANKVLGKKVLEKAGEAVVPPHWIWSGTRYSYEHSPDQFRFDRKTPFQLEFYVIAPDEIHEAKDIKEMSNMFKQLAQKFANIEPFQSTPLHTISPMARVK